MLYEELQNKEERGLDRLTTTKIAPNKVTKKKVVVKNCIILSDSNRKKPN